MDTVEGDDETIDSDETIAQLLAAMPPKLLNLGKAQGLARTLRARLASADTIENQLLSPDSKITTKALRSLQTHRSRAGQIMAELLAGGIEVYVTRHYDEAGWVSTHADITRTERL